MATTRPLAVTAGDPCGIGPEIVSALADSEWRERVVVIGDARTLDARLNIVDLPFPAPIVPGQPDPAHAGVLLDGLRRAVTGCLDGRYAGLVTAPLSKAVIADSGVAFSGHTEFLAELTATPLPVMLLVGGGLRVALASTHLPLRAVPDYLSTDRLLDVIGVLHADLVHRFGIADPDIVVCGLNPHAGEGGHLGHEDAGIIAPAIERGRQRGLRLRGPMPADTAFTPAAGQPDAVLAMYHDQGLPVLKHAGFGTAVNVTLGLPIVRTSVDHGTAFDLAGKGRADPGSLLAAVALAAEIAARG